MVVGVSSVGSAGTSRASASALEAAARRLVCEEGTLRTVGTRRVEESRCSPPPPCWVVRESAMITRVSFQCHHGESRGDCETRLLSAVTGDSSTRPRLVPWRWLRSPVAERLIDRTSAPLMGRYSNGSLPLERLYPERGPAVNSPQEFSPASIAEVIVQSSRATEVRSQPLTQTLCSDFWPQSRSQRMSGSGRVPAQAPIMPSRDRARS
jgi:hypothetical protein